MRRYKKILVSNMKSLKTDKEIPNQFVILTEEGRYFQSYDSVIVFIDKKTKQVYLDERYWNYGRTTSKYRSQFLNEYTADTQKKIDNGTYILTDLN